MFLSRRRRLFVDFKLQGALLAHTAIYWFYCLLSVSLIAFCWIIFTRRPATSAELFATLWMNCGPAILGSVLLLPLVLMDCLRVSNRFAGPMVRIQRAVGQLANGEPADPIHLRSGDFWSELAENVNRLIAERPTSQPSALGSPTALAAGSAVEETAAPMDLLPAPLVPDAAFGMYSDVSV